MNIKELKKLLEPFDEELEIGFVAAFTDHNCSSDSHCYCSADDHESYIMDIAKEFKKDKKTKEKKLVKVLIRGDEV